MDPGFVQAWPASHAVTKPRQVCLKSDYGYAASHAAIESDAYLETKYCYQRDNATQHATEGRILAHVILKVPLDVAANFS